MSFPNFNQHPQFPLSDKNSHIDSSSLESSISSSPISSPYMLPLYLRKRNRDHEDEASPTKNLPNNHFQLYINTDISNQQNHKRVQQRKIHTQIHHDTISMMMESQKILQERETQSELLPFQNDSNMESPPGNNSKFHQKPFWPIVNKSSQKN